MVEHVVLAYSGGLDTSVLTHALQTKHDADVRCLLVDLGQPDVQLKQAEARALANGAADCHVVDARETFAERYLAPAIQANAVYQDAYPLATALGRPLIAAQLVETAHETDADAVAHGCTGKGNDQVRIETAIQALDPSLATLAPQRTDPMTRDAALAYADEHGLELPPHHEESIFSVDENLWGRSVEGGPLEDPAQPVPEQAYAWTTPPKKAPEQPATIELGFEQGLPVALDGQPLELPALIAELNETAGAHGVGRIDHVEDRLVGIKSREVYEAPAAQAILTAKQAVETLTLTREEQALKAPLEDAFARLVYDGKWHEPALEAISAFASAIQANVTGTVELEAYKGSLTVTGRQAETSLYDEALATYGEGDGFDHEASTGFIEIHSLPVATAAQTRAPTTGSVGGGQP